MGEKPIPALSVCIRIDPLKCKGLFCSFNVGHVHLSKKFLNNFPTLDLVLQFLTECDSFGLSIDFVGWVVLHIKSVDKPEVIRDTCLHILLNLLLFTELIFILEFHLKGFEGFEGLRGLRGFACVRAQRTRELTFTPIHMEKRMQQLDSQRGGDVGTAETIEHEHTDRTSVKAGTEFVCAT